MNKIARYFIQKFGGQSDSIEHNAVLCQTFAYRGRSFRITNFNENYCHPFSFKAIVPYDLMNSIYSLIAYPLLIIKNYQSFDNLLMSFHFNASSCS